MKSNARAQSAGVPFSDVATYKSLSLLRAPLLARTQPQVIEPGRPVTGGSLGPPYQGEMGKKTDLPSLAAETRPSMNHEHLHAKREELRKLETCLEKVVMSEKRAQKRSDQDMKLIEYHKNRAADAEQKIQRLQEKLPSDQRTEDRPGRRMPDPLSHINTWGPSAESGRWAPGFPKIGHQQRTSILGMGSNRAGSSSTGTRSTPSLASSPRRRTMQQPHTMIVMIPSPDQNKRSLSKSTNKSDSAPALGVSTLPDAFDTGAVSADLDTAVSSPQDSRSQSKQLDEEDSDAPAGPSSAEPLLAEGIEGESAEVPRQAGRSKGMPPIGRAKRQLSKDKSAKALPAALEEDEDEYSGTARESTKSSPTASRTSMASHMADRSQWRQQSQGFLIADDPAEVAEAQREAIRIELMCAGGGAMEAFRCMDLSGSGKISLQEFGDGIHRLGLRWREITGFKKPRELFKLFDLDKDGLVGLRDLFPEEKMLKEDTHRMSTPEWWGHWCRKNKNLETGPARGPKWQFSGPEEELLSVHDTDQARHSAAERRRWISSTMRRMKNQGKSDARCRECCALHLPRGTGPKDREDVNTFSAQEVKTCKRAYNDEVNVPARNIQKTVYEMREQRRILQNSRMKLWTVTGQEQVQRQQKELEIRKNMSSLRLSLGKSKSQGLDDDFSDDELGDLGE